MMHNIYEYLHSYMVCIHKYIIFANSESYLDSTAITLHYIPDDINTTGSDWFVCTTINMDSPTFIPLFYQDSAVTDKDFSNRSHLNDEMRQEVLHLRATNQDCVDPMTNSRDASKCQSVLLQLFPEGRVFASVYQLRDMIQLIGDSWGFIVAREGKMFR